MTRYVTPVIVLLLMAGCAPVADEQGKTAVMRLYSKAVADSFSIFVNLPDDYHPEQSQKYPVVYLLDANLYFDVMAVTLNKYAGVGLAPNVILVGIGYKDFPEMDSLRNRDDTYPVAIPEYEMSTSGGADKFLSFVHRELIPVIDRQYRTDTTKRVLMGHSLGGYFTAYALYRDLAGASTGFSGYIAASPALHYNHYYLPEQLKTARGKDSMRTNVRAYFTFGGQEEPEAGDSGALSLQILMVQLTTSISPKVTYRGDVYSNLGHMDTQLPTFIKGLQWILPSE
ncbi:alpha/beta hydrolase [Chitinophaga sp. ARDCPP14]|uniref:alpha/beta hydrolase n=1 Tax=Chitinophaga sp. ARDCPP14 TaxID=3391139 RepID=UPI003F51CA45